MSRTLTYIIVVVTALLAGALPSGAKSIKASLDSSQITMGYRTAIRFEIVDNADAPSQVLFDKDSIPPQVEVIDWVYGDTTEVGSGVVEMRRALIVQSFDSGVYTIPPFLLISGPDTLSTKPLTLKVNPVDVSKLENIHPIAPALEFESRWYDFLPDWITRFWWVFLVVILLAATGVCAYLITRKKIKVPFVPQKKPVPPAELALQRLEQLRAENLWQSGAEREYYTRLIDILREYLQGRFGINAMEMTSSEITRVLNENEATRMPNALMKRILEIADIVKFAKVRPLPDDNNRVMADAVRFVEETRPVVAPVEGAVPGAPVPPVSPTTPDGTTPTLK